MKALVAICIALLFLLLPGCTKQVVKTDKGTLEEPKNGEIPPWSKFPMPEEEEKEEENEE